MTTGLQTGLALALPSWVPEVVDTARRYTSDEEKMQLAIRLAAENVEREVGGGPFGAAVFDLVTHRPVAVGVNLVEQAGNAVLHAEIVALMLAQAVVGQHSLRAPNLPPHALVTSCEPCAMWLGAALWNGVRHLLCGAAREDAWTRIGFEEGPVFPASYEYLEARGIGCNILHGPAEHQVFKVNRREHAAHITHVPLVQITVDDTHRFTAGLQRINRTLRPRNRSFVHITPRGREERRKIIFEEHDRFWEGKEAVKSKQ